RRAVVRRSFTGLLGLSGLRSQAGRFGSGLRNRVVDAADVGADLIELLTLLLRVCGGFGRWFWRRTEARADIAPVERGFGFAFRVAFSRPFRFREGPLQTAIAKLAL